MFSFSGELSRGSYAGRLGIWFLAFMAGLFLYAYLYDYGPFWLPRKLLNFGGSCFSVIAAFSLFSLLFRRMRNVGFSGWFAVIPLVLGPIGVGAMAALPQRKTS